MVQSQPVKKFSIGFEVLTAVVIKISVNRRFGGRPCFHLLSLLATCFEAGFSLGLFFDSEEVIDMFFRNMCWLSTDYKALYPRRQNF
jgi:hypothetical protein